ncbi:gamma-glutamyltransferase [Solirubrobacter sp. CPCC 204708]|uniref:Gamma-glutamyltransferase n=1 Tax=Solirubrobacter deserti TaxID=2282478 RepID=A0ABT4RNB4_9ACTN|nr:gamma-glutamyltransferase [Solirubrobacter deserti]MBE2315003.1 gamma-glutamyltransferase [Solirubrobacter deserti]MDA0139918.1 gamma-glutamyltransferase [Solirubrobacter deserti]
MFTTRPELSGTFGMVASTHWLASAAGMAVLERGGNAFDAACAAGFALQVVEPHMNGPGGDLPILLWDGTRVRVVCGQGPAPGAATIDAYRELGFSLVPGIGPYAACVPGAFDAWCTLLRDFGSWELADVLAFAIAYARDGFPVTPGIVGAIARMDPSWEVSARVWRPVDGRLRNPMLAETYERLARVTGLSREARIDAARDAWYRGWVAESLAAGFLTGDDLARYAATIEEPVARRFGAWTVFKTGPWGQGPVFLQQLALLDGDLGPFLGIEHVHRVIEGAKLAFADRDAWYGDSAPVPLDLLLSDEYARERRGLIGADASGELRPGGPSPRYPFVRTGAVGDAEPTRGDTCHLDVADRFGNLVSATPSGGWLQSSPCIDGLGFALGTRAQMFWLEEGLPSSLRPGARPRTTLSPSLAVHDDGTVLAFGTPGGDQQDQWSLEFFLAHAVFGLNLQAAIDAPMFHTDHFPSSFHPREVALKAVTVEGRLPAETVRELGARGHAVEVTVDWSQGRLSAISRRPDGLLRAGANPRGMQGYAVGR